MRKIKFRAWNGDIMSDEFEPFNLIPDGVGGLMTLNGCSVWWPKCKPVWLQYTGLKDKNGKDIYEGDIVYWPRLDDKADVKVIIWDTKDNGWKADKPNGTPDSWLDGSCVVIGNIYENPELLNK